MQRTVRASFSPLVDDHRASLIAETPLRPNSKSHCRKNQLEELCTSFLHPNRLRGDCRASQALCLKLGQCQASTRLLDRSHPREHIPSMKRSRDLLTLESPT